MTKTELAHAKLLAELEARQEARGQGKHGILPKRSTVAEYLFAICDGYYR